MEYQYLNHIDSPADLKKVPRKDLPIVAEELRDYMLSVIATKSSNRAWETRRGKSRPFLSQIFWSGVIAVFDPPVARGRLYQLGKPRQVSSEKARPNVGVGDAAGL